MNILLVSTSLGMGGAEHVVVNLADRLVMLGHNVKIAYLTEPVLVSPEGSNVELVSIEMLGAKSFFSGYFRLRNLVKSFQPDVIHSHMIHANILSRLLRLTIKVPRLICTAHNTNEGGKLRMIVYRLTDSLADISTNVSTEAVEAFISKGAVKPGRMLAITNGVDTSKFFFNSSARVKVRNSLSVKNNNIILAVGRLSTQKDYPNLLNAVALLKKQRQDFRVFIVGDGPLKQELHLLAGTLKIVDFLEFLGIRRDIKDLMSASDIFVLPSAWEGFGLVVAEAMACERFVVATDCGGVGEVVGSSGVLVEPENHKALAQELNKALDMAVEERALIGSAARQRIIDRYSLDANVEAFVDLYTR